MVAPLLAAIAAAMASTLAASRPSLKFGTHSTRVVMCFMVFAFLALAQRLPRPNNLSFADGHPTGVHAQVIRDFPEIVGVEYRYVGLLALFKRSQPVAAAYGMCGVDGRGSQRLGGGHFHLRASQRHHQRNTQCRRGAGIRSEEHTSELQSL